MGKTQQTVRIAEQQTPGVWSDPHLEPGGEFFVVDLGSGNFVELCPACYQGAVNSIMADIQSAMGGANTPRVNWNSVNWNSVNWNSVNWNSVNWNSVNWNS